MDFAARSAMARVNPRSLENPTFVEKIPIANPTRAGSRLTSVELIGAGFGSGSPTNQIEK
jgi:hypothetical protein